jgi:membrane protein YdbS with pleckstrin-like domain
LADAEQRKRKRGYLNPQVVRRVVFWTTTACIFVAVIASLLAIWSFAGTDVLWRTVATCAVVATGMMAFFLANSLFDWPRDGD